MNLFARWLRVHLSMVVTGVCLTALLGASGAVLQPPSSALQLIALNLGLALLALGHALRGRVSLRSVAVMLPARSNAWKMTGLAALGGGCLVAAFFAPSWRPAIVEPVSAARLDRVFAAPPPTGRPSPVQEIFFGDDVPEISADEDRMRLTRGSLAGQKGTVVRFLEEASVLTVRVGGASFSWPVPPARLHVNSLLPPERLKSWSAVTIIGGQDARALPIDRTVEKIAPAYLEPDGLLLSNWREFSVFLLHARDHQASSRFNSEFPLTVLSSLSSKGGTTQGFAIPPRSFGVTYPVAFTRNASGLESGMAPLTDYATVGFTSNGAPMLFPLGKDLEPFDVLAESTLRQLPHNVMEYYALRWRRTAYDSPDQVILPVRGELADDYRSAGHCLWARDVPRGALAWQALALISLVCVVLLTR